GSGREVPRGEPDATAPAAGHWVGRAARTTTAHAREKSNGTRLAWDTSWVKTDEERSVAYTRTAEAGMSPIEARGPSSARLPIVLDDGSDPWTETRTGEGNSDRSASRRPG